MEHNSVLVSYSKDTAAVPASIVSEKVRVTCQISVYRRVLKELRVLDKKKN